MASPTSTGYARWDWADPAHASNIATVTSPATPLDTTPPVVTISSPLNGATVSGTVTVSAQATDNVAVEYLEISYWNQYLGQQVILGSVSNAGTLSVNWNTSGLTPAAYALRAYAYDTLGNWTQTDITVNVGAAVKSMKVTSITLSGTVSGSKANITGYVYVKDGSGKVGLKRECRHPLDITQRQYQDNDCHNQFIRTGKIHGIEHARQVYFDRYQCDQIRLRLRYRRKHPFEEHHKIAEMFQRHVSYLNQTFGVSAIYIQADVATERKIIKKERKTMNRIMNSTLKRITVRGLLLAACIISLAMQPFTASPAVAATTLPVLWTAGGLSAGNDSAGQAARMATDASGNVAVVSGPAVGRRSGGHVVYGGWSAALAAHGQPRRRERSAETGWSRRPTAISWRSVHNVRLSRQSDRHAPWSATPPTGRSCGGWTSLGTIPSVATTGGRCRGQRLPGL